MKLSCLVISLFAVMACKQKPNAAWPEITEKVVTGFNAASGACKTEPSFGTGYQLCQKDLTGGQIIYKSADNEARLARATYIFFAESHDEALKKIKVAFGAFVEEDDFQKIREAFNAPQFAKIEKVDISKVEQGVPVIKPKTGSTMTLRTGHGGAYNISASKTPKGRHHYNITVFFDEK